MVEYFLQEGSGGYKTLKYIIEQCNSIKNNDIYSHKRRIIAIGDIHGDLEALMVLLGEVSQVCKFMIPIRNNKDIKTAEDIKFEWIGGDTFVVIVGDIIDRKRVGSIEENGLLVGEIENEECILLDFLNLLIIEANRSAGKVIKLLGNHEVMNLYSYFSYVSKQTLKENGGKNGRRKMFAKNGELAKKIIKCGTLGIVKIGSWVFVHGGVLPALVKAVKDKGVKNFIKEANKLANEMFLKNKSFTDNEKDLIKMYFMENNLEKLKIENFRSTAEYTLQENQNLLEKRDSMLNERRLSTDDYGGIKVPVSSICAALNETFKLLNENIEHIVVAHTVQLERGLLKRSTSAPGYVSGYVYQNAESEDDKRIVYVGPGVKYTKQISTSEKNLDDIFPHGLNYECPLNDKDGGQLWRIDVGLSRGFDNKFMQKDDTPKKLIEKILKARRPSALEILYDGEYTTKVLVAKKGLTRDWLNNKVRDEGHIFGKKIDL